MFYPSPDKVILAVLELVISLLFLNSFCQLYYLQTSVKSYSLCRYVEATAAARHVDTVAL